MKLLRSLMTVSLTFSLVFSFLSFAIPSVSAQDNTTIAIQRGYRTGYSDGYMAGYRDAIENSAKSYERHNDYAKADRAYNKDYGVLEDYRDGYQQGFEIGYDTGFEKRSFDATIPTSLKKRGIISVSKNNSVTTGVNAPVQSTNSTVEETPAYTNTVATSTETPVSTTDTEVSESTLAQNTSETDSNRTPPTISTRTKPETTLPSDAIIVIPKETELVVELLDDIDTEQSKEGDRFTARVVSPSEIGGAIIEGRVSKIQKPGRIKRRAEVLLTFDRIVISENRWSNYSAILTEVLPIKGDNVRRVDVEGTVEGRSSVKDDSVKVGAATGTGLVIGAIAGGPVGAAVGAGVGAAFGVGAVVVERGKHIRLKKDQQLRIKTAYETQIR